MSALRIAIAIVAVILLGAVYFAAGCRSEQASSKKPDVQNPKGKGASPVVGNTKADRIVDNLKISIVISSNQVKLNEPLHLKLSVENMGSESRELIFTSAQKFDVRVTGVSGQKVWRWSNGKVFAQNIETVTVEPGKSISYDAEWPLKDSTGKIIAPGNYNVFGKIMAGGLRDKEVEIGITVKP